MLECSLSTLGLAVVFGLLALRPGHAADNDTVYAAKVREAGFVDYRAGGDGLHFLKDSRGFSIAVNCHTMRVEGPNLSKEEATRAFDAVCPTVSSASK